MRILYFSRAYTTHDHRFLSTISGAGHEVLFLRLEQGSGQPEDRPVPEAVQQLQWVGGGTQMRWSALPGKVSALRRLIRAHRPDVVHAGPIQTCAFLTALTGFPPLLSMSWGYDLMQDVHRGRWWEWATRYTLERSAFFISDAQATRDKAVHYGMDPTRTVIFPWGIDLQHFSPKKAYGPAEQTFMLFCNRSWEPLYGVDVVARAFIKVAQQRPEASLTLLGSGSQAGLLRQILLSGDVMDRVYFGGKVAQADLPGWYHQADLYLSASHVDGSSVSLMEAMACGLPSVVSDIPGNREWVVNHHNGWLFRDGDADALAARILHAMDKRADLAEVGRRARQVAEQRADWDKNSLTLLNTYETIASQAAQKPGGSGLRKPQPE